MSELEPKITLEEESVLDRRVADPFFNFQQSLLHMNLDENPVEVNGIMLSLSELLVRNAPQGTPPEELVADAMIACLESASSPQFIVRGSIVRAIKSLSEYEDISLPVHTPAQFRINFSGIENAWNVFMQTQQREPSLDEWYEAYQGYIVNHSEAENPYVASKEMFEIILFWITYPSFNLDVPQKISNLETLEEREIMPEETIVVDTSEERDLLMDEEVLETLLHITDLNEREKQVLYLRFGFSDRVYTLEETGKELKKPVTRERVRQIEAKALRKLKTKARRVGLFKIPS